MSQSSSDIERLLADSDRARAARVASLAAARAAVDAAEASVAALVPVPFPRKYLLFLGILLGIALGAGARKVFGPDIAGVSVVGGVSVAIVGLIALSLDVQGVPQRAFMRMPVSIALFAGAMTASGLVTYAFAGAAK